MHLKLCGSDTLTHSDSRCAQTERPFHSVRTADPQKAACVFETACYGAFFKSDAVFESLLYVRRFENNYANLIGDPLPIKAGRAIAIYSADK